MAVDVGSAELAGVGSDETASPAEHPPVESRRSSVRWQLLLGSLVAALVLIVVICWLGAQVHELRMDEQRERRFLDAANIAAIDLTTLDHITADADIARIVESASGKFRTDFEARSAPLVDAMTAAKSTSVGTVVASGVESLQGNTARVIVAVRVSTATETGGEQPEHGWRMRISIEEFGDQYKIADVEFVS